MTRTTDKIYTYPLLITHVNAAANSNLDQGDASTDCRPDMDFDRIYRWNSGKPTYCTSCGSNSEFRHDLVVIKEHHASMPLGYIRWMCPEHRDRYEITFSNRLHATGE